MTLSTNNSSNWLPSVFNELFNDNFMMPRTVSSTSPAINVIENKNSYVVELAAPGMTREDFKVKLNEDKNLEIEIEKKVAESNEDTQAGRYLRREFSYTKYRQTLILPEDVKHEEITAQVENGVLTITVPRILPEEIKREVKEITIA